METREINTHEEETNDNSSEFLHRTHWNCHECSQEWFQSPRQRTTSRRRRGHWGLERLCKERGHETVDEFRVHYLQQGRPLQSITGRLSMLSPPTIGSPPGERWAVLRWSPVLVVGTSNNFFSKVTNEYDTWAIPHVMLLIFDCWFWSTKLASWNHHVISHLTTPSPSLYLPLIYEYHFTWPI